MSAKYVPTSKMVEFLEKTADDLGSERLRAVAARLLELDGRAEAYKAALDQISQLATFDNAKSPGETSESDVVQ